MKVRSASDSAVTVIDSTFGSGVISGCESVVFFSTRLGTTAPRPRPVDSRLVACEITPTAMYINALPRAHRGSLRDSPSERVVLKIHVRCPVGIDVDEQA